MSMRLCQSNPEPVWLLMLGHLQLLPTQVRAQEQRWGMSLRHYVDDLSTWGFSKGHAIDHCYASIQQ